MEQKDIEGEIEKRIEIMEGKDYQFPKRFSKSDYIFTVIIILICLIFVILGAFIH